MSAVDRPDRTELLSVFLRHEVRFVVIGGAAIQSHGRLYDTLDIDLTPDREETNLVRLASLGDVHASKRAADRPKDRAYLEASEQTTGQGHHTTTTSRRGPGKCRQKTICVNKVATVIRE